MAFSDQDILALANDTMALQGDHAWLYAIEKYRQLQHSPDNGEAGKWLRIATAIDQISARRENAEEDQILDAPHP